MIESKTTSITDAEELIRTPGRDGDLLTRYEPSRLADEATAGSSTAPAAGATWGSGTSWLDAGTALPRSAEQEWCDLCSYDETCEPGMPRDVVDYSIEHDPTWEDRWGQGPQYEVWHLCCGHTVVQLC